MSSLPTKAQLHVLKVFASLTSAAGCPPTFEELGRAAGKSSLATVSKHIHNLRKKGYLRSRGFNRARAIELTNLGRRHLRATPCPYCAGTGCA